MQSKGTSLFAQMLRYFDRVEFAKVVRQYRGDKAIKGSTTWDQCVSMLFCHLAKAQSLREICGGLKSCLGKNVLTCCLALKSTIKNTIE